MRYTITVNNKRVAYFEGFRNSRGIYDIVREYARSKWRPVWEDANGKRISAKEALEKVKNAQVVL